jgi:two-component system phosphate regulon response regulator PhoB
MQKILVVEDNCDSLHLIKAALKQVYELHPITSLGEALRSVGEQSFDLVLLDLNLPDGNGYTFCSLLQSSDSLVNLPIIFLSGSHTVADQVMGFSVGADDFVAKPFHPDELRCRIEVKLRRRLLEKTRRSRLMEGTVELNTSYSRCWVHGSEGIIEIFLTSIEFKLLRYLMSRVDEVVSRDEILSVVWGEGFCIYQRSADTHISKIRKKLGDPAAYAIESVHGSGYRFKSSPSATKSPLEIFRRSLPAQHFEELYI